MKITRHEHSIILRYHKSNLDDFLHCSHAETFISPLFECTPAWLQATAEHMLSEHETVIVHCLFEVTNNETNQEKLLIAWALVHEKGESLKLIRSLTSFYSAVTSPFLEEARSSIKNFEDDDIVRADVNNHYFSILLTHIKENNSWQQMLIGPMGNKHSQKILVGFKYSKIYSYADNWFVENIHSFNEYYNQRSSQLKNTLKRKEKKLVNSHDYHIKIITETEEFEHYFSNYQRIYQLSWKREEYSFAFIKKVCLLAAVENKLRMGVLFIDGQAVAVQLWFLQQGTASIFKLAYDPNYQQYSVGSILSMALSKHVIEQDAVTCIEFGMGSEPYKKDWMDKKRQRVTQQVFNERSFFGILLAVRYILLAKIKILVFRSDKGK